MESMEKLYKIGQIFRCEVPFTFSLHMKKRLSEVAATILIVLRRLQLFFFYCTNSKKLLVAENIQPYEIASLTSEAVNSDCYVYVKTFSNFQKLLMKQKIVKCSKSFFR